MKSPMMTAGSESEKATSLPAACEVVGVVGEEHQGRERRGADRVALGDRLGRVADRIERVGDVAHLLRQARHLGDAAGVVGDRSIGIESHDHSGHRQHGGGGDRDSVEADAAHCAQLVRAPDREAHGDDRQRGRFHRDAEAGDDVGRMTGLRRRGDLADRAVLGRGVVLRDDDERRGEAEADERAAEERAGLRGHELVGDEVKADRRHDAGDDHALVEGVHDLAALARRDEESADDRGDDRHRAERQRIDGGVVGRPLRSAWRTAVRRATWWRPR